MNKNLKVLKTAKAAPAPLPVVDEGLSSRLADLAKYRAAIASKKKVSEKATLVEALPAVLDAVEAMLVNGATEIAAMEARLQSVLDANREMLDRISAGKQENNALIKATDELRAARASDASEYREKVARLNGEVVSLKDAVRRWTTAASEAQTAQHEQKRVADAARREWVEETARADGLASAVGRITRLPWWSMRAAKSIAAAALSKYA